MLQAAHLMGGDLGWQSPYEYLPEIANPLRDEPIGAIIGPIETRVGYRFFQVLEREVRPLPEEDVVGVAFNMWLAEQKAAATIERREDWADFTPDDPSYDELLGDILPLNSRSAW